MPAATMPPVEASVRTRIASAAAVWIDLRHALVGRTTPGGEIEVIEISRPVRLEEPLTRWIALVADAVGDRERVLILGAGPMRLALEREYVAIFHRPDRIIDVEPASSIDRAGLIVRVRELAG
ncbi:MAG: hypothetical protein ACHQ15_00580 [Candidatus Limnocylindrales bacterium]